MANYRPNELVQWEQGKQPLIVNYVNKCSSVWKINNTGEVSTSQIFLSEIYEKILANNIQLENVNEISARQRLIRKTITKLKKQNNQNIQSFKRLLASEVYKFNNRPTAKYFVLFPFHVSSTNPPQIKSFSVHGITFQFRTWNYIKRNFDYENFRDETTLLGQYIGDVNLEGNFIPVLALSNGRDTGEAFEEASKAFDLLRATFNLPVQFGIYTRQIGGYPSALGKILPAPVYGVFRNDRSFDLLFYSTSKYEYKNNSISNDEVRSARRIARFITVPKDEQDILSIIVDAFEKYQKALDLHDSSQVFLSLWQILESITLQAEQIDMRDVINRTDSLIVQEDKYIKNLLEAFRITRNQLVHRGKFTEDKGLEEVGLLKSVVERAINSLLVHKDHLRTKNDLRVFYESVARGNTDLKNRRKIMGYVLRKRK